MDTITRLELTNEVNYCDSYIESIIDEYKMDTGIEITEEQIEQVYELISAKEVFRKCEYNGGYSDLCDKMLMECVVYILKDENNSNHNAEDDTLTFRI